MKSLIVLFKSRILTILLLLVLCAFAFYFSGGYDFVRNYSNSQFNNKRIESVNKVAIAISNYINSESSLPTTNLPEPESILPTLIFRDNLPLGGVAVSSLDRSLKNVESVESPIYLGLYQGYVIVYANDLKIVPPGQVSTSYIKAIEINQDDEGNIISEVLSTF